MDQEWLKQRALNVIGHELRTPASTIRGLAEVALYEQDPDARAELLAALVRNARRLEGLLDDLLAASGVSTSLPVDQPEPVDIPTAIRAAVGTGGGDVEIAGAGVARARRSSIGRIFAAIVDNARAYGERPVTISVERAAGSVCAVVDSPGPPLSGEDIDYALEPFWRGERAVTLRPGLGLGLAVASTLAAHEGGRLWVEDRAGGGLLTLLELPAA
ncbi:MAG TPA: HAMP domain-containing sensor histidine kinase [Acidimicrobiales bacterium]